MSRSKALYCFLICMVLLLWMNPVRATHNRAGEITYEQIGPLTFRITLITFTNTLPTSDGTLPADRSSLPIQWGDNTYNEVPREYYVDLPGGYRRNVYVYEHTYPASGTYQILMEDPNRNEGVQNIPNSVTVVFSVKSTLIINPVIGQNNAPIFLNPPIDKGAVGRVFIHNPSVYDPDGDSISYKLTICTGENGEAIKTYQLPKSSNKPIYIDEVTGDLVWDSPVEPGSFNIAFMIEEWRYGVKIGQITRDMQIEVVKSENNPPIINPLADRCVWAGDTLIQPVKASDPDGDAVKLSALGAMFEVENPARFTDGIPGNPVYDTLVWETQCMHVRKQPYSALIKAGDVNSQVSLVDQENFDVYVLGPPPHITNLTPTFNQVVLEWEPYVCDNILGFNIYRKTSGDNWAGDSCTFGIAAAAQYTRIAFIDTSATLTYVDNNSGQGMNQGFNYCYRITAVFDQNLESVSSEPVCTELVRGIPIITNVSVQKHDAEAGEMFIGWSKPIDLDTALFPPPYHYVVKRGEGLIVAKFDSIASFSNFDDTLFIDTNIPTIGKVYSYSIEIRNDQGITLPPMMASSMQLQLFGSDNTLRIEVKKNVPWKNYHYILYKENSVNGVYDSVAQSATGVFTDSMLINGEEHCYRVRSEGEYDLSGIKKPIVNHSHQGCGSAIDTVPPSPPILSATSYCDAYYNILSWELSKPEDEVVAYALYFSPTPTGQFQLVDSLIPADSLSYKHRLNESLAACYVLKAVDSAGNWSRPSNKACVDECSIYELPNVFTPNADGVNDLLIPITPANLVAAYVEKVDFKLFNRWGEQIFETNNPMIEWTGVIPKTGKLASPGVYYYVCDVYEKRLTGVEARYLVGFVHVFHHNEPVGGN